ncbi:MAG: phosphate ABC transporter permease PstA [Hyphomicrobium sp.]|nr:phosphate ABC transporter permease PstA [Hyphomicrobium sp.]
MTDIVPQPAPVIPVRRPSAEQSATRLKSRYAVERRFKALGLGSLMLTGLFLLLLLANITLNAIPAFSEHAAVMDVTLDPAVIDPDGKKDPAILAAADYASLTRAALMTAIPGVEGRAAKKQLASVMSSGAADDLRAKVLADPSLIGKTIKFPMLLSDDADLYFKGEGVKASSRPGTGTITASDSKGQITLTSADNAFAALTDTVSKFDLEKDDGGLVLKSSMPSHLVALNGGLVKLSKISPSSATGEVLTPLTSAGPAVGSAWQFVTYGAPEGNRQVNDQAATFLEKLKASGVVQKNFNWRFFTSGDSREPELAGIRGALVGTFLTLLVTLSLCVPIGVLAAIYLEEFAPKNWLTHIIEVNINNLAAVPSIVFGLLGLAVFLNYFGLPRSAPLVGGLVLALLVLPTIIIAARAAIKSVPPSIREAAIGLGASKQQAVFHHVLPLAMPGIMTGTIIGMAHALGETAPLLMIGMIAFIVDVPKGLTDAATVLPVQIFLWSDLPEAAFQQRTAAAIVVLLAFLLLMNGAAIWLRNKFERRW